MSDPVCRIAGTAIPLSGNDIDTDQIVPGRFLKTVTFEGLGEVVFFDQRFDRDDAPLDHPFNDERFADASILVVNANFGCGSSREHAPQALARWGIEAIVGESFAEIFADNCTAMGIPTVTADRDAVRALQAHVERDPATEVTVDLVDRRVTYEAAVVETQFDEARRDALLTGTWDSTAVLRSNPEEVRRVAESLPYIDLP